jgi:crotonobetainyl-CoA:carnitine CoA-transferase CaiB-like acyl-CoA transferase
MPPLSSLRILDFSTLLPGPFATMILADLGAEIIRIDALNRPDMVRFLPPLDGEVSAAWGTLNRSKHNLALDLKQPEGVAIVKRLVQTYDIVIEQFRPGVMARLGVGYEQLREINPRLIYCSLSGYGQTGPDRDRAGHDLNFVALSGISSQIGRSPDPPTPLPVQVADLGGGSMMLLTGLLAAEIQRRETGLGQHVDISILDGTLAWNALAAAGTLCDGRSPAQGEDELTGSRFYDYYTTLDGRRLAVAALEPQFWSRFCEAIGRSDLIAPGLDRSADAETVQQVKAAVQATLSTRTLADWSALFATLDACIDPVLTTAEALARPHTIARGMVVAVPHPDGTPRPQVACPLRFSAAEPVYRHVGAPPGAHSDTILQAAGYTPDQITTLRTRGVVNGG